MRSGNGKQSNDNKDSKDSQETVTDEVKTELTYSFSVSEDLIRFADLVVDYVDESGESRQTVMESNSWEMKFKPSKSGQYGYTVTMNLKDNADELVDSETVYRIEIKSHDAATSQNIENKNESLPFKGASVIEHLKKRKNPIHSWTINVE